MKKRYLAILLSVCIGFGASVAPLELGAAEIEAGTFAAENIMEKTATENPEPETQDTESSFQREDSGKETTETQEKPPKASSSATEISDKADIKEIVSEAFIPETESADGTETREAVPEASIPETETADGTETREAVPEVSIPETESADGMETRGTVPEVSIPETETADKTEPREKAEEDTVEIGTENLPSEGQSPQTKEQTLPKEEEEFGAEGQLPAGLLPEIEMTLPETAEDYFVEDEEKPAKIRMFRAAANAFDWKQYTDYYFYNQMNEAEREFWDSLEKMCNDYLLNNQEAVTTTSGYRTELVQSGMGLTRDDMKRVGTIFRYSNPQYYFLNNVIWSSSTAFAFGVYTAFGKGADRAAATQKVQQQIESWQRELDALGTDAEKVKRIHDLIIQKVEYNHGVDDIAASADAAKVREWEDKAYSQSAYSVFCTDLTVCAGYSQSFELMCRGAGIDCVAVTSDAHEWNKVRINDSWYNVDCTWDDQNQSIYYNWFERNDTVFDQNTMHWEEFFWEGYLPVCTLDSGAGSYSPGSLPPISEHTPAPVIRGEDSSGKYLVTITCSMPEAEIYYSIDGTLPEVAAVKCYKYAGSFEVTKNVLVQAVAVNNGYWDSGASNLEVKFEEKHTVTYHGNGAESGSMEPQILKFGTKEFLTANRYIREGYQFLGWNTMPDGSGSSYGDGAAIEGVTKDLTLYAQWQPITYALQYELGGGVNGKNPAEYNCTQSIALLDPKKTGYTFQGWYTDAGYKNRVWDIPADSTGDRTFYAKWEPNRYSIVFYGNGSSGGSMAALNNLSYDAEYQLPENNFQKSEYIFSGWNTQKDGSGTSYKDKQRIRNLTEKAGGSISLYAQWTRKSYTIKYQLNGGKNHKNNPSSYTKASASITLKNPTRTGYQFLGWYKDSKYKNKITSIPKGSTGNLTLYAKWTAATYKISYQLKGGKNNKKNVSSYKYTDKTITLKNPTRTGYQFLGWYKDSKYKNKITSIPKGSTGNLTLYAKWTAVTYKISYQLKGGKNNRKNVSSYKYTDKTIALKNPTRAGYRFLGWYKDSKYKKKITSIPKGSTGNLTLYAKWKKQENGQ